MSAPALEMESSRIFVRGLPPTMTETDFKKHFGATFTITDTRLFPQRRIGYVGYKTPDEAAKAVKYFHKTFIRMSKIGVELARPVQDAIPTRRRGPDDQTLRPSAPRTLQSTPGGESVSLKRKRPSPEPVSNDPKLQEFLQAMQPPSKTKGLGKPENSIQDIPAQQDDMVVDEPEAESESEYQSISKKTRVNKPREGVVQDQHEAQSDAQPGRETGTAPDCGDDDNENPDVPPSEAAPTSDSDWLRSKTSRLLGLAEEDDEGGVHGESEKDDDVQDVRKGEISTVAAVKRSQESVSEPKAPTTNEEMVPPTNERTPNSFDETEEKIRASSRLYLRNLAYDITEDDLRQHFTGFGGLLEVSSTTPFLPSMPLFRDDHPDRDNLCIACDVNREKILVDASQRLTIRGIPSSFYMYSSEDLTERRLQAHLPIDSKTGTPKGFAYLQYEDADCAVQAWRDMDGRVFQGRLLHILPAAEKRESQLDDFALSKLPLKKQQQIKRKREASSSTFNWNSLYMNADAVISSVADRLGLSKAELLDPTSSDAAVKQAHAETHVIQETKAYFKQNGADLDAFKRRERGDTAILIKNFPYDAKAADLKALLEEHGKLKNFLMPPAGTIAIAEFEQAPQARAAFGALAYRKIKGSVLFLEKAPKDLFTQGHDVVKSESQPGQSATTSAQDLLHDDKPSTGSATLFVRNLNFTTTTPRLTELFEPLSGFLSAKVKTKTDAKKPGQVLSMGFGFLEFRSSEQAQAALSAMNGYNLDGHKLDIRASHKASDAAEERRREDKAKKQAGKHTKVIIKNLPFEVTKKDIQALFSSYGQLRSVRLPKKMDRGTRGFAFADFTTPKEAENAMEALRDTHLLGRRLVLDFAAEDPEDAEAEIEKMQSKVGSQINKVALQALTGTGRRKFNVGDQEMDDA